jgi:hypothetical protein
MRQALPKLSVAVLLFMFFCPSSTSAGLIGDAINFERVSGQPIPGLGIFDDVVGQIVVPGPDWVDPSLNVNVDVEDSTITLANPGNPFFFYQWTFVTGLSPAEWIWSDLDWVGQPAEIVGTSVSWTGNVSNPESFSAILLDGHSVKLMVTGTTDVVLFPGSTFTIHLDFQNAPPPTPVPEPSTFALFSAGTLGLLVWGCRRKRG